MNICITYVAWQPARWQNHPLPYTFDDDPLTHARELIAAYTFMGFDALCLSAFPDTPTSPGEYKRAARFLDVLQEERAAGRTKLTAFLMYEPYDESYWDISRRLRDLRQLAAHPAYTLVDGRPAIAVWRLSNFEAEQNWRVAKWLDSLYGSPPWFVYGRIRNNWRTERWAIDERLPVDRRIDRNYHYPQERFVDFGACQDGVNHAVAYNTAAVKASTQTWLLRPDLAAFTTALREPVPAGADRWFRDGEENEAGNLLIKTMEWEYMLAVRRALLGAPDG